MEVPLRLAGTAGAWAATILLLCPQSAFALRLLVHMRVCCCRFKDSSTDGRLGPAILRQSYKKGVVCNSVRCVHDKIWKTWASAHAWHCINLR